MTELYIGLMSGTSVDGIDVALVDFGTPSPLLIATHYLSHSTSLRKKILSLCQPGENEIERFGELDVILGKAFAHAANQLLKKQSLSPSVIKAIGSHGQTIRHIPNCFTMQIGDPNIIAAETGITTVADFRRKDMAYGGQGAPLVPAFHQEILTSNEINRVIVNIGGIANLTFLPQKKLGTIIGFDTGPGNTLLDSWIYFNQKKSHDEAGQWGAEGMVHPDLLEYLLSDAYFEKHPPKSTGREYFNLNWLKKYLNLIKTNIKTIDVQATLVELTARSILFAIRKYFVNCEILICGGGVHNQFLMQRLKKLAEPQFILDSTQKYGLDPNWIEATAFAWLAKQTLNRKTGNLPSVTGAREKAILGGIYYGI